MITGAGVLLTMVKYGQRPLWSSFALSAVMREDGLCGRYEDGRSVAPVLRKLQRAGLVAPVHEEQIRWRLTERGIEVDAIHASITAARGGTFMPQTEAGLSSVESFALR